MNIHRIKIRFRWKILKIGLFMDRFFSSIYALRTIFNTAFWSITLSKYPDNQETESNQKSNHSYGFKVFLAPIILAPITLARIFDIWAWRHIGEEGIGTPGGWSNGST